MIFYAPFAPQKARQRGRTVPPVQPPGKKIGLPFPRLRRPGKPVPQTDKTAFRAAREDKNTVNGGKTAY
jgi:hypothetical protein